MVKIRVYELARELKVESKLLLSKIKEELGLSLAGHQSMLTSVQAAKVKSFFNQEKPKVVVRKRKNDPEDSSISSPASKVPPMEEEEAAVPLSLPKTEEKEMGIETEILKPATTPTTKEEMKPMSSSETQVLPPVLTKTPEPKILPPSPPPPKSGGSLSSSSSATIIRRATAEESAALRRHDSRSPYSSSRPFTPPPASGVRPGGGYSASPGTGGMRSAGMGAPSSSSSSAPSRYAPSSSSSPSRPSVPFVGGGYSNDENKTSRRVGGFTQGHNKGTKHNDDWERRQSLSKKRKQWQSFSEDEENQNRRRRHGKKRKDELSAATPRAAYRVVKMETPTLTVGELARQLSVKASQLIAKLMSQGVLATLNHPLDFDTVSLIASEYGFECKNNVCTVDDLLERSEWNDLPKVSRPPIVAVMGHVDHGKTSILDAIRQTQTAAKELGGITQHVGAHIVTHGEKSLCFLDTPGHAAFSAMRARGAKLTDVVVLVVAADDGVMPQTIEAIQHAKEAHVSIVVAINKMDKPQLQLDRIKHELSEYGIQDESWGGEHQFVEVSALKRQGIDELLDAVILQSEMLDLKARFQGSARGVVVEAHLDKRWGPVATVIVLEGELSVGQFMVAGLTTGKIRTLFDPLGKKLTHSSLAQPILVSGFSQVPRAGDILDIVKEEKVARDVVELRRGLEEAASISVTVSDTPASSPLAGTAMLDELLGKHKAVTEIPSLHVIIKADTQGSMEAICHALEALPSKQVRVVVVHKGVGDLNETDLNRAEGAGALVCAFQVNLPRTLEDVVERKNLQIQKFGVIYELLDAIKSMMVEKLPAVYQEIPLGKAEVRMPIHIPKMGCIAGSFVSEGKVSRGVLVRLWRKQDLLHTGKVTSLKRFKEDVKDVTSGYECGIGVEGWQDLREGDRLEFYRTEAQKASLEL